MAILNNNSSKLSKEEERELMEEINELFDSLDFFDKEFIENFYPYSWVEHKRVLKKNGVLLTSLTRESKEIETGSWEKGLVVKANLFLKRGEEGLIIEFSLSEMPDEGLTHASFMTAEKLPRGHLLVMAKDLVEIKAKFPLDESASTFRGLRKNIPAGLENEHHPQKFEERFFDWSEYTPTKSEKEDFSEWFPGYSMDDLI